MSKYDPESRNALSHYALDETEAGGLTANHHLDNALTCLCLALQRSTDGRTANHLINALLMCANAKFGQGPL